MHALPRGGHCYSRPLGRNGRRIRIAIVRWALAESSRVDRRTRSCLDLLLTPRPDSDRYRPPTELRLLEQPPTDGRTVGPTRSDTGKRLPTAGIVQGGSPMSVRFRYSRVFEAMKDGAGANSAVPNGYGRRNASVVRRAIGPVLRSISRHVRSCYHAVTDAPAPRSPVSSWGESVVSRRSSHPGYRVRRSSSGPNSSPYRIEDRRISLDPTDPDRSDGRYSVGGRPRTVTSDESRRSESGATTATGTRAAGPSRR